MAFNLSASIQRGLTTTVNTVKTSVNTVSQNISAATGLSTQSVNSGLAGAVIGGLLNGGRGAAIGAVAGGLLGGGANNLLGQIQGKLGNLISNASELQGLSSNPLKLVELGVADLIGLTGDEFGLTLSQYNALSATSPFSDFISSRFMSPYSGDDTSASRIPNPLRSHNSFNYVISLGILDAAEYNNPELYRSAGGFKNYIIQSSGGNLDKRYQVFDETGSGISEHAEYYIDDIDVEAVVAPNPNTRVTAGTSISFTVVEPYSMGNFIQAIIGSASEAGYGNYNEAPFCLKIDFVGWNLDGTTNANFIGRPIFIPIKFINMEFNVTGIGSTYAVKAVPMSESGLSDNINQTKTSVRASGLFLHQVLETNDASVSSAINSQIQGLEEAGALTPWDRYIIAFPKDRTTLQNALQAGAVSSSALTTSPEEREEQRRAAGAQNPQLRASFSPNVITITPPSQTYAVLKSFAENTSLMNEIGLSPLNEDTNAPGNSSEADASAATNPETGLVDTQSTAAQPVDKARDYQFNQNEKITSIIEKLVLQTRYAAERSTEGATDGLNKWFKIETQVFIDDSPLTELQMGRRPKVYVYSVMTYEIPEATTLGSNSRASNIRGLQQTTVKEYNYTYTGKNEDVLNFDINFNNAFLLSANSDFGMTSGTLSDLDAAKTATGQDSTPLGATPALITDLPPLAGPAGSTSLGIRPAITSGTHSNDVRLRIAEMFHDRITNMTVDMVTAEMEIIGDPYFLPQDTGNYSSPLSNNPSITVDGTMPYSTGPVLVDVNFRSPFDYQVKGATMEMPLVVPGFSGLFQVWAVTNSFSRGKFTQRLKMIRLRRQEDAATTGNSTFMQVNNDSILSRLTTQSDGTVGQSGVPSIDGMLASLHDDIRNLMPAVGNDIAAQLTAPFRQLEQQLTGIVPNLGSLVQGVDFGIARVPDLTKVIPRIASSALGNVLGAAVANTAVGAQARAAASQASNAVNTAANQGIASATNSATSRVRNLLG